MNHAAASEYDTDLLIWIHQQVELLRAKKFDQLDIENLIDEVESIGIQFKIEFSDHLEMVMKYLLKCEYQAAHPPQKWKSLLWDHRCQMSDILEDMPSLENSFDEY
ncbi:MAG: DUF29 domain-containing protein, partial [Paludibacterium sp.]|uniref:DUF29 domain-containing protein n=1 Tax=Paludibacterium sp. TaxID=1917523 RepID=UPI0025CD7D2D